MSGFPNRIARSSLGPTLEDKWPVVDPKHDIGASSLNLLFHQVGGMNLISARGLLFVDVNSGTGVVTTLYQGIAWDPDGLLPKITWTRSAAGIYSWSLPQSSYADEAGNMITVEVLGGFPMPQELVSGNVAVGQHVTTGVRSGTVHILVPALSNTHYDSDFIFLFW
ncbi:MAG: hypothetical protein WC565_04870 [Parcubacteria group bacterium]